MDQIRCLQHTQKRHQRQFLNNMRLTAILLLLSAMVALVVVMGPKSRTSTPANIETTDNSSPQKKATITINVDASMDEHQVFSRPTNVSAVKPEPKSISNKQ